MLTYLWCPISYYDIQLLEVYDIDALKILVKNSLLVHIQGRVIFNSLPPLLKMEPPEKEKKEYAKKHFLKII